MSIAEKLTAIAEKVPLVFKAGESAEAARCAGKHFVTTAVGDGTGTLVFDMPFEPDFIIISSFNAYIQKKPDQILYLLYDLRALGMISGTGLYLKKDDGTVTLPMMTATTTKKRFLIADGVCTVTNIPISATTGNPTVFSEGEEYFISAIKYIDKTDKERMTEYINALSDDGGTVTLSQVKKEANFTEEEWATLIAAKPNWTFNLG